MLSAVRTMRASVWTLGILLVVGAAAAWVPTAAAHTCGGEDCGPCVDGEDHQHGEPGQGGCVSHSTPGFEAALVAVGVVAALGLVALRRRRQDGA